MAISITLSDPIEAGDTVTAQSLHDLVESATISGLAGADLSGASALLCVSGTAPNPSNFPFWYRTAADDRVFKVFAEPFGIWLTAGPDRFEVPLRNGAGQTVHRGALVVASGASEFSIATNPSINVIGVLQETAASGAWAPVCVFGVCFIHWASAVSNFHRVPNAGEHVIARNVPAGFTSSFDGAGTATGPFFGTWLEGIWSGVSDTPRAFFHGPRLTSQFNAS